MRNKVNRDIKGEQLRNLLLSEKDTITIEKAISNAKKKLKKY
jgi:hypothetical protein